MGLMNKNPKIHFTHLQGRRKKVIERYQNEKKRAQEQNIQYDSSSTLLNSNFLKNVKEKHQFVKNKYKFNEVKSNSLGHYSKGVLTLSKFDLKRINEGVKQDEEETQQRKRGKPFGKRKNIKKGRKH